jgi:hypothetical protein
MDFHITQMYNQATSAVQINGNISGLIPILTSVRQGCSLSRLLFEMYLNSRIHLLEQKLAGIEVSRRAKKAAVVVYADDSTTFVVAPDCEF